MKKTHHDQRVLLRNLRNCLPIIIIFLLVGCSGKKKISDYDKEIHNFALLSKTSFEDINASNSELEDYGFGMSLYKAIYDDDSLYIKKNFPVVKVGYRYSYTPLAIATYFTVQEDLDSASVFFSEAFKCENSSQNKWLYFEYFHFLYSIGEYRFELLDSCLSIDNNFSPAFLSLMDVPDSVLSLDDKFAFFYEREVGTIENINVLNFYGDLCFIRDSISLGIGSYKKALSIEENSISYFGLGDSFQKEGKSLDSARFFYLKGLKLDSLSPAIFQNLAWVSYDLGKYIEARRFLRRAVSLDPVESKFDELFTMDAYRGDTISLKEDINWSVDHIGRCLTNDSFAMLLYLLRGEKKRFGDQMKEFSDKYDIEGLEFLNKLVQEYYSPNFLELEILEEDNSESA